MSRPTTTSLQVLIRLSLLLVVVAGCEVAGVTPHPGAGQTGVFFDDLDGFEPRVWQKASWTNGGMFDCGFVPENVSFPPGELHLTLNNAPQFGKPYSSGEYRTLATFGFGRFEARFQAAKGSGTVTSFFLYTGRPWDEIDVEVLGKDTTQVQFNFFVNGVGGHEKLVDLGFDASQGFHTYAIDRREGAIGWWVDGVKRWEVRATDLPSHPLQIMVNLWPGTGVDGWLGPFTYTAPLVARYDGIRYTP